MTVSGFRFYCCYSSLLCARHISEATSLPRVAQRLTIESEIKRDEESVGGVDARQQSYD